MTATTSVGSPASIQLEPLLRWKAAARVVGSYPSVFVVGTFPRQEHGSRGISEDLFGRLASAGWSTRIVSRNPGRIGRVAEMLWTSWRERDQYQVAAVDVYSGPAFFWARATCWMLRRLGKPYILMLHGGNLPKFAARKTALVRSLLQSAAAVTTPSQYLSEHMRTYRDDIQVLPNGISMEAYPYKLRAEGAQRLIWLRAFHDIYNPEMAIRVLSLLKQDFPSIHLTMIGPDKGDGSLQKVQKEAERLGVTKHLTLTGSVRKQDVPQRLAEGDIFLNTARIDNTPVSIVEAMASGLCVVSTDVGGIPQLVRSEQEALLVPTDSAENMAQAVRRIITDSELSQRLSRNARRRAQEFDWPVILPRWESLLNSVSGSKS